MSDQSATILALIGLLAVVICERLQLRRLTKRVEKLESKESHEHY